jgi:asparagine synthase (glutamine-hydrolysing)
LRGWAEEFLSESSLAAADIVDPHPIRRKWDEHLAGGRSWSYELWTALMWVSWHRRWMQGRASPLSL